MESMRLKFSFYKFRDKKITSQGWAKAAYVGCWIGLTLAVMFVLWVLHLALLLADVLGAFGYPILAMLIIGCVLFAQRKSGLRSFYNRDKEWVSFGFDRSMWWNRK
ncbi:MAG: hypothetical protein JWO07_17 [Candidatus Saccharibacteria bacterium]|nr:hypothetical protein [Candidatus Saccharibacteria bacterium]